MRTIPACVCRPIGCRVTLPPETSPGAIRMIWNSKSARRWIVRLGIGLLGLIALNVAWHFRPLNATERKLVGTWSVQTMGWSIGSTTTLTPDRRFQSVHIGTDPRIVTTGSWSASARTFSMRPDIPWDMKPSPLWIIRQWATRHPSSDLTVRASDQLEFKGTGGSTYWQRVSSESTVAPTIPTALPTR
jgi:hypothetical protein